MNAVYKHNWRILHIFPDNSRQWRCSNCGFWFIEGFRDRKEIEKMLNDENCGNIQVKNAVRRLLGK